MRCVASGRCFIIASLVLLFGLIEARAENWPQWRGAKSDGISKETGLPAKFSPTENVAWKLHMPGVAGSTPVIWGDRIFLTTEDGADICLMCVSTDGKQLWKQKIGSSAGRRYRSDEGNDASPSPSTDGKHVFAYFGTGDFVCTDLDGKEAWRFNAQERYGKFRIQHGMHVSPCLHGDRLYISLLHSGGWFVIALDKETGKEVWKINRKSDAYAENEQSYASPSVWENGKDSYLIVHGNDYTTAHRLSDGGEIWRLGDLNPKSKYNPTLRLVSSPVASPDLIVVPTAKSGPVIGLKPDAKGMINAGSPFEQWRRPRDTPDVSSPLLIDGLVYLCRENGVLICMDAKTGKEHYQQRLHSDRYRASPVYADGKIYCIARGGVVSVVKHGPTFELLAANRMGDTITASVVVSNGRLYLRGWENLYAISEGGK